MKGFLTKKAIIVDDDKMIAELGKKALVKMGYDAVSFNGAEEMLSSVKLTDYDFIVSDLKMPGLSGIDLLREIRMIDEDMPVIIMTGISDLESAISAIKEGVFDYVQKPFTVDQIIFSAKRAAERRKMINQNKYYTTLLEEKNTELQRLYEGIKKRNFQLENDMQLASILQDCLYPMSDPNIPGWEVSSKIKSYEKISGDFYHFDLLDDGFSLVFADVSGHGVAASLYSAIVKAALLSVDRSHSDIERIVSDINKFILNTHKKMSYSYVALVYLRYYSDSGLVKYVNCGMPSPLIIMPDGEMVKLETNSPLVGIFDNSVYHEQEFTIDKDSMLFFFTDGIYEYKERDTLCGYNEFVDKIIVSKTKSLNQIIDSVFNEVISRDDFDQRDDITVLGMKLKGGK
ncbi:MAG: SpoIIE family protein phosphatase [Spirochaetes bacterium]|nr:SpoIIE family protein phosphatase [Spirochaetota bacterium]